MKKESSIIHPQKIKTSDKNDAAISPIYQTAKFHLSNELPLSEQFIYTRGRNPTLEELEKNLATIQGKDDAVVTSSGMSAISGMMLSLLESGDHVISFRELYRPGRVFIRDMLPKYGISSSILKLNDFDALEKHIIPGRTKLIHFESPSNPNLVVADIEKILQIARKHELIISMDGTFAGIHQHGQFDIDVMIHSLTKSVNGHGDVIAGAIIGKKDILKRIKSKIHYLGATLDPHTAFLISRGMKTYFLRWEHYQKTTLEVATYLSTHPKIEKVYYPGLTTDPGYSLANKQMKQMIGVISFEIKSSVAKNADEFCGRLKMLEYAVSLGSTETLICPTSFFFGEDLSPQDRDEMGINSHSIRLSIGLEAASDIINDLNQALG